MMRGMTSVPLSRRAYAAARDVSEGAIRKAILAGKIALLPSGLIDPALADESWYRHGRRSGIDGMRGDVRSEQPRDWP